MATGMARSSGRAGNGAFAESFSASSFTDPSSGTRYRVTKGRDAYAMEFERPAADVKGGRELSYFIGSGNVGRSYAFSVDGFLFQAPVSYYSSASRWDLSPGYTGSKSVNLAKPIEEACLLCHASGAQLVVKTQNRYGDPPFLEGGVSCERCHGSGKRHVEGMRAGKAEAKHEIVNPSKLDPARRDSICLQCHLTGAAKVARAGHSISSYRPGDLLQDHVAVFVWPVASGEAAATDHAEQLARSKCRIQVGPRLWCGTCHDPHSQPTAEVFRKPCLGCHAEQQCNGAATARAAAKDDCASCHMPKARSREGEHVAYTDHSIQRRRSTNSTPSRRLVSFWPGSVDDRDLAVAYASLAMSDASFRPLALQLMEKLETSSRQDATLLAQLAQFYDYSGKGERAEAFYEQVLRLDAGNAAAAANLGIYRMRRGRAEEAIRLWKDVFARYPALSGPAMNLANAQFSTGDTRGAQATLLRVLQFHPDLDAARQLLSKVSATLR